MKRRTFQQGIFKVTDRYDVIDEEERIIYNVEEKFHWLKYIAHVTDARKEPVFRFEKQTWSWRPEYDVFFSDGQDPY